MTVKKRNARIQVGPMQMRAQLDTNSYNEQDRTIDVIFATDTPVRTYSWRMDSSFYEILSFDKKHVRMERMLAGAPVLDNHARWNGVKGQLGKVIAARLDGNKGIATLKLSGREDLEGFRQDVKDGIVTNISVGYEVFRYERMSDHEDGTPQYRAIDWEPKEVSFAPLPADYKSGVRSEGNENPHEIEIIDNITDNSQNRNIMNREQLIALLRQRGLTVDENISEDDLRAMVTRELGSAPKPPAPPAPNPPAPKSPEPTEAERNAIAQAERERIRTITDLGRKFGMDDNFITTELVDKNLSLDAARAAIMEKWEGNDPNAGARNMHITADETDKRRDAVIDGLVLRSARMTEKEIGAERTAAAREFRSMKLVDLAKDCLERAGISTRGLSNMEIVGRAITSSSSDFPVLLEGTNRRILLGAYNIQADAWRKIAMVGSVSDFREHKRLRLGSLSRLDKVNENGEYKTKKINDAEFERIEAETFGNIINVSRKMIVNDDLAGFTRLSQMLGRAAARSIEIDVFAMFKENGGNGPLMADGNPLFHASHNNVLSAGGAPSVAQFEKMRQAMALQMDPDSNDYIDLRPSIWLGPITLSGEAKVINGSQYDPDAANKLQRPNKVVGLFSEIVDTPRLEDKIYYALAAVSEEPVFEVAFLDGVQTPFLDSEEAFTQDGMSWKVRLDYGVGAIGWRGIVKSPTYS